MKKDVLNKRVVVRKVQKTKTWFFKVSLGFLFAVLIFFTLTILAIFILRVKRPDIPRPYKAFGYPVIPSIYILTTITIMVILLIYKPDYTFPGLGIVILGIPVFYLWRKYNKNPLKNGGENGGMGD